MVAKHSVTTKHSAFLARLESEALQQSVLYRYRWLPRQADGLTSLIGRYTWQFLVVTATIAMVLMQVAKV